MIGRGFNALIGRGFNALSVAFPRSCYSSARSGWDSSSLSVLTCVLTCVLICVVISVLTCVLICVAICVLLPFPSAACRRKWVVSGGELLLSLSLYSYYLFVIMHAG